MPNRFLLALPFFCAAFPATAQDFTGPYVGAAAGVIDHHVWITETAANGATLSDRYYRDKDFGGSLFAGYDVAIAPRLRIGGEVALTAGGGDPEARFSNGTSFKQDRRYGYRLSVRGGVVPVPGMLVYASGGYGGDRYRLSGSATVADAHEWGSSFLLGAGVEAKVSGNVGLRFDFKHVDNTSNQWLLGVPVRF